MTEEQIKELAYEKCVNIIPDYTAKDGTSFINFCTLEKALIEISTEATKELQEKNKILERRIVRAKECMKKLLYVAESEHLNCKGLMQDAEDFIHNRMCPLRKQGQHCITKEPCIMCDKE